MKRVDWLTTVVWFALIIAAIILSYAVLSAVIWLLQAVLVAAFGLAQSSPHVLIIAALILSIVLLTLGKESR